MEQLDKIEALLDFQYWSTNYTHLMQAEGMTLAALKKHPNHIHHMAELRRIRNDMQLIANLLGGAQKCLLEDVEKLNEVKFEYLLKKDAGKPNNGKGLSVTK